ncbi:hypothetical protein BGZ50_008354 [Haplosporangium sp. Z 11]|nr:hypothetical protein BGZ50_008354 [Haplosporangium sp. Z 11]
MGQSGSPTPSSKQSSSTKKPAPFQNLGLHSGAASGNLGLVKFALDNGQPIDSVLNGVFAIHAACCSNTNIAVVLYLIEHGADVNAKRLPRKYSSEKGVQTVGTTGSTPLHFAAANGCLAVVDILLRHGAIVDMTDKYGSSPLSVAAARNHPEVASLLRQYSAMQRGVQDLTPDADVKDLAVERRGSDDHGHRAATTVVVPSTRTTANSEHQKDPSAQSLALSTGRAVQTTRAPGQRRISLPSIVESPSPNIPPPPRQSCDFDRTPQSTEPLVRSTASIRSVPSQPTRNVTMSPSRREERIFKPVGGQSSAAPQAKREQSMANSQRSPPSQGSRNSTGSGSGSGSDNDNNNSGSNGNYLSAPDTPVMKRRRSMESMGLLSPQSAVGLSRRKSFDQLSSVQKLDSKSRRSSDASTDSQQTASSVTSGTSGTSVSENGHDSIPVSALSGGKCEGNAVVKAPSAANSAASRNASMQSPPLLRSSSQPALEQVKNRRLPASFMHDTAARQSLDLQMLISNQERTERERNTGPRNDSDSDLPGYLLRRRTMQETPNPRLVPMPRYHSMGLGIESHRASLDLEGTLEKSQPLQQSTGTTSDIAAPRHSTGSLPSGHSTAMTFSGSATVSGRFSRIWTGAAKDYAREGSAGNWNAGEFGEASGEAAAQSLVRPEHSRARGSMLNRLSGMWSRRMPPKKKNKYANASARGFATTSIPKAKPVVAEPEPEPEPVVQAPPTIAPADQGAAVPEAEEPEDEFVSLAERLESLSLKKVDAFLGQTQKINVEALPVLKMESNLENSVLGLLKEVEAKDAGKSVCRATASQLLWMFLPLILKFLYSDLVKRISYYITDAFQPNVFLNNEQMVAKLNVTYLSLLRLGFEKQDIEEALNHTYTGESEDALDWLCMHLDSEKLPRGFADKLYHEEEMKISVHASQPSMTHTPTLPDSATMSLPPTTRQREQQQQQQEEENAVSISAPIMPQTTTTAPGSKEKEWILQAALAENSDEEVEDPNERYVSYKLALTELSQALAETTEPADRKIITRKIDTLDSKVNGLDIDFTFNKKVAESMLKQRIIEDKKKAKKSKRKKEKEQEAIKKEKQAEEGEDDGQDMLGSMWDLESGPVMSPDAEADSQQQTVKRRQMANPSWSGGTPKVVLAEFCRKKDRHSKLSYKKAPRSTPSASMAIVTVIWGSGNISSAEMTDEGCENMAEAENYVATKMLYELTPLPLYRSLPPTYRDLWLEWIDEKESAGRLAKKIIDGDRMSFIKALVAKMPSRGNTAAQASNEQSGEEGQEKDVHKEKGSVITQTGMALQENWRQRLKRPGHIKLFEKRKDLPIYQFRDQLLTLLKGHQVLIVSGETGCGKSTQVPQYLVEFMLEEGLGDQCDILCTQPRRISAISIANRVSEELGDGRNSAGKPNTLVGYQIRLESRVAPSNILKFCTTGILLRRLESDKTLKGVTHLVIDEVHERTLESDFLLIILKKLLPSRPDLKVILMSATVDSARFSEYFGGCPVLEVPGRTFPVHAQFLEEVIDVTGYTLEEDSEYAIRFRKDIQSKGSVDIAGKGASRQTVYLQWENDTDDYTSQEAASKMIIGDDASQGPTLMNRTQQMLNRIDENRINFDLIQVLLEYICFPQDRRVQQNMMSSEPVQIPEEGAILIFLPGMPEIRKLFDALKVNRRFGDESQFSLWPLHSSISSEGQSQVFDIPPPGVRKIVMATNIAETGITIPDVTIVIDTGKSKQIKFDEKKRVTTLQERFIAKANARQRRGRAGRVQEGVCFHMFSKMTFDEYMPEYQMPEIMRMPLEELCLMIKMCELGEIAEVLGSALDAPPVKAVENAIQALQDVRALTSSQELTPLGIHLCNLPVDVHIGKMILFGSIFKCLDPILTIAAMLSFKSPFVTPFGAEDEADAAKARFKLADSDMLTWYNAYLGWRQAYQAKPSGIYDYCRKNFLSHQNLTMMEDMKKQFLGFLVGTGFVRVDGETKRQLNREQFSRKIVFCPVIPEYNVYQRSIHVLNAAITAGMYPKVMMRNDTLKAYVTGPKQEIVYIHPSSVNFTKGGAAAAATGPDMSPWFVFNSLVKSTRMYVWESCRVGQFPLVLFGGELSVKHHAKLVTVDKWIQFKCHAKTAVIFKMMREELDKILQKRIDDPKKGTTEREERWLEMIVAILEGEDESLRSEDKAGHQRHKDQNVFLA